MRIECPRPLPPPPVTANLHIIIYRWEIPRHRREAAAVASHPAKLKLRNVLRGDNSFSSRCYFAVCRAPILKFTRRIAGIFFPTRCLKRGILRKCIARRYTTALSLYYALTRMVIRRESSFSSFPRAINLPNETSRTLPPPSCFTSFRLFLSRHFAVASWRVLPFGAKKRAFMFVVFFSCRQGIPFWEHRSVKSTVKVRG